ncbi:hypothetical protein GSI_03617 [Ganoderma sinense ZZ0214-1]|uniref:Uncharacterized protein n=1 Tax=Ganoderma sinense ZZ0214-1 TaxID=1077348 RepID=A0A2G8SJH3_9APHY|nr:hypothetical protein GSI_03617 [Ganoderma sinense ZZ0214-1]
MTGRVGGSRSRSRGGRYGWSGRSTRTVDLLLRLVAYLCSQRVHRRALCCRKVVGAIPDDGDVGQVLVVVFPRLRLNEYSDCIVCGVMRSFLPLGISKRTLVRYRPSLTCLCSLRDCLRDLPPLFLLLDRR